MFINVINVYNVKINTQFELKSLVVFKENLRFIPVVPN